VTITPGYIVRAAAVADLDTLVAFTVQEAREAEGLEVDETAVRRGVAAAFADQPPAAYWIAERGGQAAASISVVREWSNFRGGYYWWIQSVFILPQHRATGLIDLLIDHVAGVARAEGALDLRLYAHTANERALQAYRRCGFTAAPYVLMTRRP
jgi:GNAT superfamily N-acetyltransferase